MYTIFSSPRIDRPGFRRAIPPGIRMARGLGTNGGCPPGYVGFPPYCAVDPFYTAPGPAPAPSPAPGPSGGVCPPATVGVPPICIPSSEPVSPPTEVCPPGTVGYPPFCTSEAPGGGVPPQPANCPPGYTGSPPFCGPAAPGTPQPSACPAGYLGVPPLCVPSASLPTFPVPTIPPTPTPTPAQPEAEKAAPAPASWWDQRSSAEKGLVVGGAAIAGYLLVRLLTSKPAAAPKRAYAPNLVPGVRRTKTGIPVVRGKRWGHPRPPKKYRQLGATRPGQYAYPERFMYPVHDRRHVVAAKGYFAKHKADYPMPIRQEIAKNINKAAKRVGLSADVKP